jgi:predicted adenylyl cyclase CyaB
MPSNVEIKARAPKIAALRQRVAELSDSRSPELLKQEDVFFAAPSGRLKLRIFGPDRGELIHYHRANVAGPKTSQYAIAPTSEPHALREILGQVLPVLAVVRKRREVYLVGQIRVHLDEVEDLGDFMELEVVLRPDQAETEGVEIAQRLMKQLGIANDQLVKGAYVDLILASSNADRVGS